MRVGAKEDGDKRRAIVDQVLTVVEDEQRPIPQRVCDLYSRICIRRLTDPQGGQRSRCDRTSVGDRGKLDPVDSTASCVLARDRLGEARLADASGSRQGHDSLVIEQGHQLAGLAGPPDQRRQWDGNPVSRPL